MARELLSKQDGFLTVTIDGKEHAISNIKRSKSHANADDTVINWTLNTRDCGQGNLKR